MVAYIQCTAIVLGAGITGMDSRLNFAVVQERCFAPEGMWTRHPQFGNCRAPNGSSMFTQVNFSCNNRFGHALNDHGIKWRCLFATKRCKASIK